MEGAVVALNTALQPHTYRPCLDPPVHCVTARPELPAELSQLCVLR